MYKVGKHSYFLQKTSLILYSTLVVGVDMTKYFPVHICTNMYCNHKLTNTTRILSVIYFTLHLCFRFLVGSEREAGEETPPPCTLEDELKTPANRPSVQRLVDMGKTAPKYTHVWDDRTSLGYYPFKK